MIVLDASAAINIVRGTPEGKGLASLVLQGEKSLSPDIFCVEVANAAWKLVRFGNLSEADRNLFLSDAVGLVDEFAPVGSLITEALSESIHFDHPVYDMLYLVLARRTASTLFTLDKKLAKTCVQAGVNVVELAEV